eukprot:00042.XXX_724_825_1 [CDS] Oithona nana genome sequencing.
MDGYLGKRTTGEWLDLSSPFGGSIPIKPLCQYF